MLPLCGCGCWLAKAPADSAANASATTPARTRVLRLSTIMGIPPMRWTLAAETRQIDGSIESVPCELQKPLRARRIPAAVSRVGAELALDLFAPERLVHAAADMRLALLEHAA